MVASPKWESAALGFSLAMAIYAVGVSFEELKSVLSLPSWLRTLGAGAATLSAAILVFVLFGEQRLERITGQNWFWLQFVLSALPAAILSGWVYNDQYFVWAHWILVPATVLICGFTTAALMLLLQIIWVNHKPEDSPSL